jgi:rod shape-determining protein MreC
VELSLEGLCCITGLERSTAITTGGEICTSGLGGKYPKDLIVGAVREVLEDSQGLSAIAVIEPAANIASLRDVFVLTNF